MGRKEAKAEADAIYENFRRQERQAEDAFKATMSSLAEKTVAALRQSAKRHGVESNAASGFSRPGIAEAVPTVVFSGFSRIK